MIVKVNMIFFTIALLLRCHYAETFVLPPAWPNTHQDRSQGNQSRFPPSPYRSINGTRIFPRLQISFDFSTYRSSWKFIDKNTIRVRFHLNPVFLHSVVSSRFLIRHLQSGQIRRYDESHEMINSTLTIYIHHLKHGRHMVCLLVYTSKYTANPRHIFCQDINNNFHKYGHTDMDSDDYRNTFFFLLTQYAIVCAILCVLQFAHVVRKQRILRTLYDKANALRQAMFDYHHQHRSQETNHNKSSPDLTTSTRAIECLIYNLDRRALYNFDQMYMRSSNVDDVSLINHSSDENQEKNIRRRSRNASYCSLGNTKPLLQSQRSITKQDAIESEDEDPEDEDTNMVVFRTDNLDTRSHEDQSMSYKSISHILDGNKPWMVKMNDDGTIQHTVIHEEPLTSAHRV